MLLGLDTTTERIHAALVADGRHWGRVLPLSRGQSQSRALLPLLDELLAEAGAGPEALTGVVCCVGPGGFTSLRVGVATAEGLALTGLPTWGFSAFELRAKALEGQAVGPRWILLDGQRQEAFLQRWDAGTATGPALQRPLAALASTLGDEPWWAPEGFRAQVQAHVSSPPLSLPHEGEATIQALAALCRKHALRAPESPLVPFYLRETDAEVHFPEASLHLPEALRRGCPR